MGLRLEIISRQRQNLGERSVKEFGPDGGTIGRSLESDWVLPDGQRYLSSRHASIDYRAGSYYVIDTSTNGVYVNGAEKPVGRGNPQRLFSDDRIRIGDYVMRVTVDDSDSTGEQLAGSPHVDPVDSAMRVDPAESSEQALLAEHEITGVGLDLLLDEDHSQSLAAHREPTRFSGEFDLSSLSLEDTGESHTQTRPDPSAPLTDDEPAASETPSATSQRTRAASETPSAGSQRARAPSEQAPEAPPARRAAKAAPAQPRRDAKPVDSGPKQNAAQAGDRATGGADDAFNAFLTGAGLEAPDLEQREIAQIMHTLGRVMRETVTGLTESLHLRAVQKGALKQSNTTIQPSDNNPLKFTAGIDESLRALLFGKSAEYMSSVDAVRGAFRDVKLHQQTLMRALYTAVERYTERLDPDQIEEQFANGRRGTLLGATNKLKYWDYYKDLYLVLAQHPTGELPAQFLEELAKAYDEELGKSEASPVEAREAGVG